MPLDLSKYLGSTKQTTGTPATKPTGGLDLSKYGLAKIDIKPDVKPTAVDMSPFDSAKTFAAIKPVPFTKPEVKMPTMGGGIANTTKTTGGINQIKQAQQTQSELLSMPKVAVLDLTNKLKKTVTDYIDYSKKTGKTDFDIASNFISSLSPADLVSKAKILYGAGGGSVAGAIATGADVGLSGVGVASLPLTIPLVAGSKLPGPIGSAATAINTLFERGGILAGNIAVKGFESIPDAIISKQSKDTLRPAVSGIASLMAQVLIGHGLGRAAGVMKPKAVEEVVTDYSKNVADIVAKYDKEITPVEAQQIATTAAENTITNLTNLSSEQTGLTMPKTKAGEIKAGEKFTPKVGKSIESNLVEAKLIEGIEDIPQAERITFKDQAEKAAKIVNEDVKRVEAILRGEEPKPSELTIGALFDAVEAKIEATGDVALMDALMKSPLIKETSIHAQELTALRMRRPDSLVSMVEDIIKTRENNVKELAPKAKVEVKAKFRESLPKAKDWSSYLESLKCK